MRDKQVAADNKRRLRGLSYITIGAFLLSAAGLIAYLGRSANVQTGPTPVDTARLTYYYERFAPEFGPNLISWWRFDEGSSDIAYDSAGSNHGTIHGAKWTGDGTLRFNGVDDYVELPDNRALWLPQHDFTVSIWVYFDRDPGSEHEVILDLNRGGSSQLSNALGYNIQIRIRDAGKLWFGMSTTASAEEKLITEDVLVKNRWYHIVAVRDGVAQTIYLDGRFNTCRTCSPDPVKFVGGYDDDKVNIGAYTLRGIGPRFPFKGKIDDLRIYNTALSAEEIQAIYQTQRAAKPFAGAARRR